MWWFVASMAFSYVAGYLLRPRPQKQNEVKPTLDDIEVPVSEEGKTIGVVFGRRHVQSPNVVWYGDLKTTAIKSDGGGGKGKGGK